MAAAAASGQTAGCGRRQRRAAAAAWMDPGAGWRGAMFNCLPSETNGSPAAARGTGPGEQTDNLGTVTLGRFSWGRSGAGKRSSGASLERSLIEMSSTLVVVKLEKN